MVLVIRIIAILCTFLLPKVIFSLLAEPFINQNFSHSLVAASLM